VATQTMRRGSRTRLRTDAESSWATRRVTMHRRPEQERISAVLFDRSPAEFDDH